MLAYGSLLGLPLGDPKATPTLLVLGHSGDVMCSLSTDGDELPQLHSLGAGGFERGFEGVSETDRQTERGRGGRWN